MRLLAASLEQRGHSQEDVWREARLVVAEALHLTPLAVLQEREKPLSSFSLESREQLQEFSQRRLKGEPLSRIRARRAFWKSDFFITPATLDPRPETEGLVELACRFFAGRTPPVRILDLGTGTGCLVLSLAQEFPEASGLGVDCSREALEVAQWNAQHLQLQERCTFRQGDWLAGLVGTFDLIVTNPPYIPSTDLSHLSPEVRDFDPLLALDGGEEGLDAYQALIPQVAQHLEATGLFLLECGIHQEKGVRSLLEKHFPIVAFSPDLAGIMRYGAAHHGV